MQDLGFLESSLEACGWARTFLDSGFCKEAGDKVIFLGAYRDFVFSETSFMLHSLASILLVLSASQVEPDRWFQHLGPNRDGSIQAPGLFGETVGLEVLWKVPLGSGFSSVLIEENRVYTMHAIGEKDALSSFDAKTGKKRWSYVYGPSFPKKGSSEAGPLSTPVLDDDHIYALGAHGELFCLESMSGKEVWRVDLTEAFGAILPDLGFTSSPLIYGSLLILNIGDGQDKSIAALNKRTGKLAWHVGAESINHHSPTLAKLKGRNQIIAMSRTMIRGLDPYSGEILWYERGSFGIQSIVIGDDLILADSGHGFRLYRLQGADGLRADSIADPYSYGTSGLSMGKSDALGLKKLWENEYLSLMCDMPVHHEGFLYGFKGAMMNCVDLETGEKMWSSRKPGMSMAILVDGHVAAISKDGLFHIIRASPKAYESRASIKVFEKSGVTEPSYANGVFYMRSFSHLAAVRVK